MSQKLIIDYDILNFEYGTPENALMHLKNNSRKLAKKIDTATDNVNLYALTNNLQLLQSMIVKIEEDINDGI